MKFGYVFVLWCVGLLFFHCKKEAQPDPVTNPPPVTPPNALPKLTQRTKAGILSYFDTLVSRNLVLTGQHCGYGPDVITSHYNDYVEKLYTQTGKYVGLIGAEFGYKTSSSFETQPLINFWNKGGLITINWSADNPWTAGYDCRWNSVDNKEKINLLSLLKNAPDSPAKTLYRSELANVAKALQTLRDAGVVILWRPFHEMNSQWFWWGANAYNNQQTNAADYVALWKDLYQTLTVDYGLTDMIWIYSPNVKFSWNADVKAFYPGDTYVDVVGESVYAAAPSFPDYEALKSLGKPVVMSEAGPDDKAYGTWDETALLNAAKGKAAYFLQWHSWEPSAKVAIIDNQNAQAMMNSADAITLDEIK